KSVEAALQTDPENDELLKLRCDLQEVITLTRDLIQTQLEEKHKSSYVEPSSTKKASSNYFDDIEAALLEAEKLVSAAKTWRIGDKRHRPNQKEYLKKRKQKKQQRFKDLEEERESDKNKWLNFSTKNQKKTGLKAKSIFASPDNVSGRVGVGTCGTAGKGMTDFTIGEKYRKGL
ncbi:hypothetical protein M5D96_013941, partial [Drosophila gunungcola]